MLSEIFIELVYVIIISFTNKFFQDFKDIMQIFFLNLLSITVNGDARLDVLIFAVLQIIENLLH